MDFEKAVSLVGTVTDLRRIASAHVIDYSQLKDEELPKAPIKIHTAVCGLGASPESRR